MPILQQIQKNNLLDVLVIVVRYFGGTKLGIRGLIEAYGDAAAEVLRVAEKIFVRHVVRLWVCFPPEISSQVFGLIHRHKAQLKETDYNREGHVLVAIPASSVSSFTEQLTEATGGRARWEERND
jgi:putative IMPACT (imprinted ancient) family translation regulator